MANRFIKTILILASITGILGCVGFYIQVMLPNNLILADYEREFDALQHPPGTSPIATYGKVGWMELPFPEACNFLVTEARLYSDTEDAIREFYEAYGLILEGDISPSPAFREIDPKIEYKFEPLRVIFFDHATSQTCERLNPLEWSLSAVCSWANRKITQDKYYIVFVTSPGYEPGNDPRCNFAGW